MFRSRIAETYFNKINKNKRIYAESAGIIEGVDYSTTNQFQLRIARKLGIDVGGRPKGISVNRLKDAEKIIIVADDVPKAIFNYKGYKNKVSLWKIKDVQSKNPVAIKRTIKNIIKKVDLLIKLLEKTK